MSCPEEMMAEAIMGQDDPLWELAEEMFRDNCVEMENGECEECKAKGMVHEDTAYPDGYYCKDCMVNIQFQVILEDNK